MPKMGSLLWYWTSHQNNLHTWTWVPVTLVDSLLLKKPPQVDSFSLSGFWGLLEVKHKPFLDSCQNFALWHFQGPEGWCGEIQRGIGRVNLLGHPRLMAAAMVWKQKLYKQTSIWDQEWKCSKLKWKRHGSFLSHVWAVLCFIYHLGPHWQILRRRSLRWEKILVFFSANEKKGELSMLK